VPDSRLARQVQFIVEVDKLKDIYRQTVLIHSGRAENDAEHSWHLCLLVIVLAEHANLPNLDLLRVLKMLIIHDLVEIDAGDTFAYDAQRMADQYAREAQAAERIFGLLPDDQTREFRALWEEFEAKETAEARFASAVDRFQPVLLNLLTKDPPGAVTASRTTALWRATATSLRDRPRSGTTPRRCCGRRCRMVAYLRGRRASQNPRDRNDLAATRQLS
jgi:putative hydrolase of HD superfamily